MFKLLDFRQRLGDISTPMDFTPTASAIARIVPWKNEKKIEGGKNEGKKKKEENKCDSKQYQYENLNIWHDKIFDGIATVIITKNREIYWK